MIVGTVNGSNCNTLTHICQTWQIDTSLATSTAPLTMVTTTLVTTPNNINGVPQVIQRAVAGALEGTMSSCQDLPPDGVLDFTKILVHAYS
jgi:hypothetical protein